VWTVHHKGAGLHPVAEMAAELYPSAPAEEQLLVHVSGPGCHPPISPFRKLLLVHVLHVRLSIRASWSTRCGTMRAVKVPAWRQDALRRRGHLPNQAAMVVTTHFRFARPMQVSLGQAIVLAFPPQRLADLQERAPAQLCCASLLLQFRFARPMQVSLGHAIVSALPPQRLADLQERAPAQLCCASHLFYFGSRHRHIGVRSLMRSSMKGALAFQ